MELAQILKTLWDRKLALALVTALAVLAAVATVYSISPSGLKKRSYEFGAAQTQILVDSPRSSLIDLSQETPGLATRAAVYAQFMRSNAVIANIARIAKVPRDKIVAQGPYTTAGGTQNLPRPAEARANEIRQEGDQYRLVFDAQQDLPIVSIYAQAPTSDAAVRLADATVQGVRDYVAQLEAKTNIPAEDKTEVRGLGEAEGGTVNQGSNPMLSLLAFIAVFIAGCGAIIGFTALGRGFRRLAVETPNGKDSRVFDGTDLAGLYGPDDDPRSEPAEDETPDEPSGRGRRRRLLSGAVR